MQVTITGQVGDSDASLSSGRIEFSQAQRIDTGEMLVTGAPATAQVIRGELRTLDGNQFQLPSNPENTAVRVREILGGQTFEWWTAVPDLESVEYRELPIMQSHDVPGSVWGPPPWVLDLQQAADATQEAIQEGMDVADALGGLAGIQGLVDQAESAATDSASSAEDALQHVSQASTQANRAESEADRAETAADSIDMSAINARLDGMDTSLDDKVDKLTTANRLYGTSAGGAQTSYSISQGATSGTVPQRTTGGRLPGIGAPATNSDATTKKYVDDIDAAIRQYIDGSKYVSPKNPFLEQATLYSYGHSFTAVPSSYCTSNGGEHVLRIHERIGFAHVQPYGRGGTPLPDTLANAMNNSRVTDKNRNWPGLDVISSSPSAEAGGNDPDDQSMPRGIVTIQNYINEIGLGYGSPEFLTFWKQCLRSLIAVVSSKAQRSYSTDVSGPWNEDIGGQYAPLFPKGQLPAGHINRSNTSGAYRQYRVKGDSCWIVTLGTKGTVAGGPIGVYVDGVKIQTISPMGDVPDEWNSVIPESQGFGGWPLAYKVTGLNAAAGTTGWKTVRFQLDSSSNTYLSTVLIPRVDPPEIFLAYEPTREDMTLAEWNTENAKYKAVIDEVAGEFDNVHIVDLDVGWDYTIMTPAHNFHPNDRGQDHLASRYVEAINDTITDWNGGIAVL